MKFVHTNYINSNSK